MEATCCADIGWYYKDRWWGQDLGELFVCLSFDLKPCSVIGQFFVAVLTEIKIQNLFTCC